MTNHDPIVIKDTLPEVELGAHVELGAEADLDDRQLDLFQLDNSGELPDGDQEES